MTYDPIDTSASDDSADSTVTVDDIDTKVFQGLNLDDAPAGNPVRIVEENGQPVFTAFSPDIFDDFEHNNLSGIYSGATGFFDINQSSSIGSNSTFGLQPLSGASFGDIIFTSDNDLPGNQRTPKLGEVFDFLVASDISNPGGFYWRLFATGSGNTSYEFLLSLTSAIRIRINPGGAGGGNSTSINQPGNTTYRVVFSTEAVGGGNIEVKMSLRTFDPNNSPASINNGSEIASVSITTSEDNSSNTFFGFNTTSGTDYYIDRGRILGNVSDINII